MESHEKNKILILNDFVRMILLNLIKKGIVYFLFAILAYVHEALWRTSWKRNMHEFLFFWS